MQRVNLAVALLMTVSSVAFAQSVQAPTPPSTPGPATNAQNHTSIRAELANNLKQSGFNDVKVMPEFLPRSGEGQVRQPGRNIHHPELVHGGLRDRNR